MRMSEKDGGLEAVHLGERVRIEAWGKDSVRIRATMYPSFTGNDWALTESVQHTGKIVIDGKRGSFENGRIRVTINEVGVITIYKDEEILLRDYFRYYDGTLSEESRCLRQVARDYRPYVAGDYRIVQRFESTPQEKIFGLGQYQQPNTNLKGCILDLEQRNSQVTIPFALSSRGYGFLWNNPAVGRVTFGNNLVEWVAEAAKEVDYWVTAADTPKEILFNYTSVTGRSPMMPEDRMGLWQCKLRYRTQQEVLDTAKACVEHGVPIDLIVIDYFHWTYQGDWKFDPVYWPDPKAMVEELHRMGIKVVVSVWPSVDKKSENYLPMSEDGLLIRTERGGAQTYDYQGDCVEIDATNPATSAYVWDVCRRNYYDIGIDSFWLDNSEPDFVKYDFDHYRYHIGPALEVSNIYPQYFSRIFYDHMKEAGDPSPVNLLRSAWAGSQKYGNVVWSGDVPSTFASFRDQLQCGINMGLAGIAWWTTDVGGFMTDDVNDPSFRELLIRWFEFAVYTAVLRMHGDRGPYDIPALDDRDWGGGYLHTGQPNELWSYGEENFAIMKKYLGIRHELKPYLISLYKEAHENGSPLIRAMFYEYPEDEKCWNVYDQYMFGSQMLVAPVLYEGQREREVYLPEGVWEDTRTKEVYSGRQTIVSPAPLESIPVFRKID